PGGGSAAGQRGGGDGIGGRLASYVRVSVALRHGGYRTGSDGGDELGVVGLGPVGDAHGEPADRLVHVAVTGEVPRQQTRVERTRVGAGEQCPREPGVVGEVPRGEAGGVDVAPRAAELARDER